MSGFNEQDQSVSGCGEKLRFGIADPSECLLQNGCSPADIEACRENSLCVGSAVLHVIAADFEQDLREIEG